MASRWQNAWGLIKTTASDWDEDNASRLAAALAFYTLLSLAPMLIIAVSVAGLVFGAEAARGQVSQEISSLVGPEAGKAIEEIIAHADKPSSSILGTIIGLLVLLFSASGVFGELQASLNTIWEVTPRPGRGVMGLLRDRFFSFTMVLGVAFLLLVSLVVSAALAAFSHGFEHLLPGGKALWQALNLVLSLGVSTGLFALIYKVIPDARVGWRDVGIGAFFTALLFTVGKFAIGLYLGHSTVASAYGAAASVVVIAVWVFYSAQILFLGAEFTQVYAQHRGARIIPTANAVPVTSEARAQQGMPSDEQKSQGAAAVAARQTAT
jgi:membrane protein